MSSSMRVDRWPAAMTSSVALMYPRLPIEQIAQLSRGIKYLDVSKDGVVAHFFDNILPFSKVRAEPTKVIFDWFSF
jgi:hypothetical protein